MRCLDAVLAHVGDERAVVAAEHGGLDVAEADERLAGVPGFAVVVADGHDRDRKRVGVERQQDAAAGQDGRLAARLPAEALVELVAASCVGLRRSRSRDVVDCTSALYFSTSAASLASASSLKSSGLSRMRPSSVPVRRAWVGVVVADFDSCVRHDSQVLARIIGQKSHRRLLRSIIMQVLQSGKPGVSAMRKASLQVDSPLRLTGAVDGDVVGAAFAGAAIPGDEQVAVRAFDDAGGVVVLVVEREDELGGVVGGGGGLAGQHNRNEEEGIHDWQFLIFN